MEWIESFDFGHAFLYACTDIDPCLEQANTAYHDPAVQYAYPNWLRSRSKHQASTSDWDDPLFSGQWYLDNRGNRFGSLPGEDLHVISAWDHGQGTPSEIIAIVDDGLQIDHEDLIDNVVPGLNWDFVNNDSNPAPLLTGALPEIHGTQAAGVAAARGDNGKGIRGVAPFAGLVGLRLLGAFTAARFAHAITYHSDQIDIYNSSWGATDNARLNGLAPIEEEALREGVRNGREGKGSLFVFSAGNGQLSGDNSNFDGYANSPYTVAVAASTDQGQQARYSEKGANLWVNAPSSNMVFNILSTQPNGQYSEGFGGTSAAAAQVSGVIALMLEQNPDLGWRDVQHILATTAKRNDPVNGDWIENGVGYWVNHAYGFGRVDAAAASAAAAQWLRLPPQTTSYASTQTHELIPDNNDKGISSTITTTDDLFIDYVEVFFRSDHPYWGDLDITLISPAGTTSKLAETGYRSGSAYQNGWRFGIARLLGESSQGDWILRVKDRSPSDIGSLHDWSITIFGSETSILPGVTQKTTGIMYISFTWPTTAAPLIPRASNIGKHSLIPQVVTEVL